jgi:hypothetical protein
MGPALVCHLTQRRADARGAGRDGRQAAEPFADFRASKSSFAELILKAYRSGRSPDWVKVKSPNAPAVTRLIEE